VLKSKIATEKIKNREMATPIRYVFMETSCSGSERRNPGDGNLLL
jgi:hypothetical protein